MATFTGSWLGNQEQGTSLKRAPCSQLSLTEPAAFLGKHAHHPSLYGVCHCNLLALHQGPNDSQYSHSFQNLWFISNVLAQSTAESLREVLSLLPQAQLYAELKRQA